MFCPQCGKEVKDGAKFCENCGWAVPNAPIQNVQPVVLPLVTPTVTPKAIPQNQNTGSTQTIAADEKYCPSCGSVIKKIAEICPKCGVRQDTVPYSQNVLTEKKNNAFFVLSIFFNVAGIVLYIISYFFYHYFRRSGTSDFYYMAAYSQYLYTSLPATAVISIGILFSIISLYRKPNKLYFWISISPCILLAIWNVFFCLIINLF